MRSSFVLQYEQRSFNVDFKVFCDYNLGHLTANQYFQISILFQEDLIHVGFQAVKETYIGY